MKILHVVAHGWDGEGLTVEVKGRQAWVVQRLEQAMQARLRGRRSCGRGHVLLLAVVVETQNQSNRSSNRLVDLPTPEWTLECA